MFFRGSLAGLRPDEAWGMSHVGNERKRCRNTNRKVTTIVAKALKRTDPAAHVAQLHLFGGLSVEEASAALRLARAMAYRNWNMRGPDSATHWENHSKSVRHFCPGWGIESAPRCGDPDPGGES